MLIVDAINELTVFTDEMEDKGMDVSLMRYLCLYLYIPHSLGCDISYNKLLDVTDGFLCSYGNVHSGNGYGLYFSWHFGYGGGFLYGDNTNQF